jgi:mannose-6-phosphate isomerase-like protein (cupin superfamily)
VGTKRRRVGVGAVIHVPRGTAFQWTVLKGRPVRYIAVRSLPRLETVIDRHGAADNWRG